MIRRKYRLCFRLTEEEVSRYKPLIYELHAWDWSGLIRMALNRLAKEKQEAPPPLLSAARAVSDKPIGKSDKRKTPTKKKKPRRKAAAV